MKLLLITPPLTQLNTPYPATTVLKGYLEAHGHPTDQADLGIELINRLYTSRMLAHLMGAASPAPDALKAAGLSEWQQGAVRCVDVVMRYLRGEDNTLAPRIANRSLLPEWPRFRNLADMEWAFGTAGTEDKARHLATLFVEDVADWIRDHVDAHFDLIRYAEQIATYAATFDELEQALTAPLSPVDELMLSLLEEHLMLSQPAMVGFTIPFPGCLYGALRCGQYIKAKHPGIKVVLGGGFPTTEWRQLNEPRIYDYCEHNILDDGERPLLQLADSEGNGMPRLFVDVASDGDSTPDFSGLPMGLYLSLSEMTNPMHRLWSQGRWNKMMMAHGCYWHQCAFCDTTLPYIARYQAPTAVAVVDRMERIAAQTGVSGFHFVDEALPPKLLEEVSRELLRRGDTFSWWGNIRFEKAYTQGLCDLMADAGCVAVSGGLEVASDRLLKLMHKGVTIQQTVQACRHFRQAGIMVHTYLMYGFPTETLQESVNALEVVRRMFDEGIVQSAFWHRYAMTCHSPSGQHPEAFGAKRLDSEPNPFCNNEVDWEPAFDYDIEAVGDALRFATFNYMNEIGLEMPLKNWFTIKIPKPTV